MFALEAQRDKEAGVNRIVSIHAAGRLVTF